MGVQVGLWGGVREGRDRKDWKKRKWQKETAVSFMPMWVSIQAPTCELSRKGQLSRTPHCPLGDQAWKPASCMLLWDSNPQVGLTHVYTSVWESAAALQQRVPVSQSVSNWGKI